MTHSQAVHASQRIKLSTQLFVALFWVLDSRHRILYWTFSTFLFGRSYLSVSIRTLVFGHRFLDYISPPLLFECFFLGATLCVTAFVIEYLVVSFRFFVFDCANLGFVSPLLIFGSLLLNARYSARFIFNQVGQLARDQAGTKQSAANDFRNWSKQKEVAEKKSAVHQKNGCESDRRADGTFQSDVQ